MSNALKELIYVRNLLLSVFIKMGVSVMRYDNTGAGFLAENATTGPRTKHIDIKYHHIRECISSGLVRLLKVDTKLNLADLFTKPLGGRVVKIMSHLLMNMIGFVLNDLL